MKRLLLLSVLTLFLSTTLWAFEVDGINYTASASEATVSSGSYSGEMVIPETVTYEGNTYTVTSIYVDNPTPPSLTSTTFSGVDKEACFLYVPVGSSSACRCQMNIGVSSFLQRFSQGLHLGISRTAPRFCYIDNVFVGVANMQK